MPRGIPNRKLKGVSPNPKKAKAYNTEYAELALRLSASGANEADIAYLLGTNTTNLRKWKSENEDFAKALNRGAKLTRAYLVSKGIKAAAGYDYIETRTKNGTDREGNPTEEITKTTKHVQPNGSLLMFLLGCLDRRLGEDNWIARQYVQSNEERNITVKVIDGNKIADQIEKLGGKWKQDIIDSEFVEPKQITGD